MDAPEDDLDVKLQKISADLIGEFDRSLPTLLRRTDGSGRSIVRSRVRTRKVTRLVSSLLDPFQELPQLLDPYLPKWVPLLGEALLEYLRSPRRAQHAGALSARAELLMSLPAAICKLLYTLCKIRGEKVIVRFLGVETKNLELLLSALEEAEAHDGAPAAGSAGEAGATTWGWEERYIVLLWLSHLLLAPFDLSSISSLDLDESSPPDIRGFEWPSGLPGITTRLLPLGVKYLASPGKERDGARALLVRMAMRKDMQEAGLLEHLVRWTLSTLRPRTGCAQETPYFYIGRLAFLAGILAGSADTSDMDPYLGTIHHAIHAISSGGEPAFEVIVSSALARKSMIKVVRSVAVLILRKQRQDMAETELIAPTVGYLLDSLADHDTPVRLAASKALSVITVKLATTMASQVVEAVLEALRRNVIWTKGTGGSSSPEGGRDLRSVNPLEWHGLMLTLSHLLYRRSPPAQTLADIVQALVMGLSFEQRNTSGGSVGANVRDAACFGVWALARRYTTAELLAVSTQLSAPFGSAGQDGTVSMIQLLATALVVTACVDPAGNIRRGASAALQELIGRHPDTVTKGIWVVQAVDYHAVALRSRALGEVALKVTNLDAQYGEAVLLRLLGWPGVGDADTAARRVAGATFGAISAELSAAAGDPAARLTRDIRVVLEHLEALQDRQAEERHGLLLALASTLDHLPALVQHLSFADKPASQQSMAMLLSLVLGGFESVLRNAERAAARRPELISEAVSQLIVSMFPVFQTTVLGSDMDTAAASPLPLMSGGDFAIGTSSPKLSEMVVVLHSVADEAWARMRPLTELMGNCLAVWLLRSEKETVEAVSRAALVLLALSAGCERAETITAWAHRTRQPSASKSSGGGKGYFYALTMSYMILPTLERPTHHNDLLCNALLERWSKDTDIDTRVAILGSLTETQMLRDNAALFTNMVCEGLDDYTTNARGDVGSHVRLQALKAAKTLWRSRRAEDTQEDRPQDSSFELLPRVLRLAVEKLDRVRAEAQTTLALALPSDAASQLLESTFSSQRYFHLVLDLLDSDAPHPSLLGISKPPQEQWMQELLAGYVTSADTGNEDLVIASRAALCAFCEASPANLEAVCAALVQNLRGRAGQDRVLVPTLEVVAFLFYAGIFPRCGGGGGGGVDYKTLCLRVQRAHYKTGSVRKIEACVKVYGAVASLPRAAEDEIEEGQEEEGGNVAAAAVAAAAEEALRRLGTLLFHPWPRVRSLVVEELWGLLAANSSSAEADRAMAERLKGVDWGRADKEAVRRLVTVLQLE